MKRVKYIDARALKFSDEIPDLSKLEIEFNMKIPPVYKSFISNFKGIRGDIIKLNAEAELQTLTYYVYIKDGIDTLFEGFMKIGDSLKWRKNSDSWIENNVMPIGQHSHGGCILVGVNSDNSDKIYYEHDSGVEPIESNIYSFLRNLEFVLVDNYKLETIFKNWGDEFWRIKENTI